MYTIKTVLQLEEAAGKVIENVKWTLTAESLELVAGEVLGAMTSFMNRYNHANKLLQDKIIFLSVAFKNGHIEEIGYKIAEYSNAYGLTPFEMTDGAKFVVDQMLDQKLTIIKTPKIKVKKKEETKVKQETAVEVEFDVTVGNEVVEVESKKEETVVTKEEKKAEEVVVEATKEVEEMVAVEDEKVSELVKEMADQIKAAGIDASNPALVTAFVLGLLNNKKEEAKVETAPTSPVLPELAGDMHDKFVEVLKGLGMSTDAHIFGALDGFSYGGADKAEFVKSVRAVFGDDKAKLGEYFRKVMNVDKASGSFMKTTVYVTADTFRATGDTLEAGVVALAKAVNKYGFHLVANLIEKTVGGRPDALKDHNYVKDAAGRAWDKVKPEPKKKEEKKEVKAAELEI